MTAGHLQLQPRRPTSIRSVPSSSTGGVRVSTQDMDPTKRLYLDDSWLTTFQAPVIAHGTWQDSPSVVLQPSAFYPETGGQMADAGTLGGTKVRDVQVDEAGVIHHLLDGPLPAVGETVEGVIDRSRRRLHMALHTGQHILSKALLDVARAETVSSRLGETVCTIDVDRDKVDERDVARAEELANAVIEDDVPVRAIYPTAEELMRLPLRRQPKVDKDIRVVMVGDFDCSPCGGTHCSRSGQVALVRINNVERYKGKIRVSFSAGRRARTELGQRADILNALGRDFTCSALEVPQAVDKMRRELTETREALGLARSKIAMAAAEHLVAQAVAESPQSPRVIAVIPDAGVELLRAVAKRVTSQSCAAAFLATPAEGGGLSVLVARGSDAPVDCGAFLKAAASAAKGRGGGNPDRAEGRLPEGTDWVTLVRGMLTAQSV